MNYDTVYIGRTRFAPYHAFRIEHTDDPDPRPWSCQYHGSGHYFRHLESALAYATGRGFITANDAGQIEQAIISKLDADRIPLVCTD